jgi:hypothetical protein
MIRSDLLKQGGTSLFQHRRLLIPRVSRDLGSAWLSAARPRTPSRPTVCILSVLSGRPVRPSQDRLELPITRLGGRMYVITAKIRPLIDGTEEQAA